MVSIIIKSFNRPYYLDRCLKSIDKNVTGRFNVTVLDDGTPNKYLNKILELHPTIEIKKSKNHNSKSKKIENNEEVNGFDIPTDLWVDTVRNSNQYVLVTEEDVWFTETIDLNKITETMNKYSVDLTKLGWLGSRNNGISESIISNDLISTYPEKLFSAPSLIMNMLFYNKFKIFSLLYKLGIVDNNTQGRYWILNSILMGLYNKEYWLHIWKYAQGKVNEKQQLINAASWFYRKKSNKNLICKYHEEVMKTTFSSSATNSYHKYGIDIDINQINKTLNEAWLLNQLDTMENYPKDFSKEYILSLIGEDINIKNWENWVKKFKEQYANIGCNVE